MRSLVIPAVVQKLLFCHWHDRGAIINLRARLGCRLVQLREEVRRGIKLSRSTPPRTLKVEREKVQKIRALVPILKRDIIQAALDLEEVTMHLERIELAHANLSAAK